MFHADTKILVVDDSSFARTILKSSLKDLKFWKILEAENVKKAIALLSEEEQKKDPVQLIFCDIHMPDLLGIELVRWMRSGELYKDTPVIILTSAQEKGLIVEAGKMGVSHFLIKPFDTATLKDRIVSTFNKRQLAKSS